MTRRFYAGIGSRRTPPDVLRRMSTLALERAADGWVLRSGGAEGADEAFERGAGKKEIFLPWRRFRGNPSLLYPPSEEAIAIAATVHPAWQRCSRAAQIFHGRNVHVVLGADLRTPVEEIVCWTPGGAETGGTATAIRLARKLGIRVSNLFVAAEPTADEEHQARPDSGRRGGHARRR